ncbi:hypothetical protein PIB30_092591 [Stylosanthes scabra]|uniref:Putative plant transposon protein domain-containing protein n=1 Tax=Stylosanthes scabra TaxID=79078 RepID=A0ABU6QUC7_9FABA|nr:hypothetical protein [Stylosanthes scabra]
MPKHLLLKPSSLLTSLNSAESLLILQNPPHCSTTTYTQTRLCISLSPPIHTTIYSAGILIFLQPLLSDFPSCLRTSNLQVWCWQARPALEMSSSSDMDDPHCFRSQFHQDLFEEHVPSKSITPKTSFDLQEDEYPEIQEQIAKRGWRRLSKPRTKISKVLIQEFYANAVRTKEEIASGEAYPYNSYVRGVTIDFSASIIREILRIRENTLGAETDFNTRQREDQRLDEVIRDICVPGARWKMSSSQPDQPIQLKRQDLTPLARGWAEFIIHSIISTGNKSKITVARAVLIHSIIRGRMSELKN